MNVQFAVSSRRKKKKWGGVNRLKTGSRNINIYCKVYKRSLFNIQHAVNFKFYTT